MNGSRKSDSCIVPEKPPNKGCGAPLPAEGVEGEVCTMSWAGYGRLRTGMSVSRATSARHYPR
jgi:hypothetical protein